MQFVKNVFNKYKQYLIQQECEKYKSKYPIASKSFFYAMELNENENADTLSNETHAKVAFHTFLTDDFQVLKYILGNKYDMYPQGNFSADMYQKKVHNGPNGPNIDEIAYKLFCKNTFLTLLEYSQDFRNSYEKSTPETLDDKNLLNLPFSEINVLESKFTEISQDIKLRAARKNLIKGLRSRNNPLQTLYFVASDTSDTSDISHKSDTSDTSHKSETSDKDTNTCIISEGTQPMPHTLQIDDMIILNNTVKQCIVRNQNPHCIETIKTDKQPKKRGRPRKQVVDKPKKKRGRPKK